MNNREYILHLLQNDTLNKDEVKIILNYLVNNVKSNLDVNTEDTRLCKESSLYLLELCDKLGINYIPLVNNELGMSALEHHYGVVILNTDEGKVSFLIDVTYIQFKNDIYSVNFKPITSPSMYLSEENKNKLVNDCYLTLTEENFNDYIKGFIESCKQLSDINEEEVFERAYSILTRFNINLLQNDYLKEVQK